jgi:hypothetical protein
MSERVGPRGLPKADSKPLTKESVRFADPTLQAGFTQVPNIVLRDRALSFGARLTYAILASYAWQGESCFPGQATLAACLGISDRQLRAYITELKKAGLLDVQRRGLKRTNLYLLLADRKHSSGQDRKHSSDKEDSEEEHSGRRHRDGGS